MSSYSPSWLGSVGVFAQFGNTGSIGFDELLKTNTWVPALMFLVIYELFVRLSSLIETGEPSHVADFTLPIAAFKVKLVIGFVFRVID